VLAVGRLEAMAWSLSDRTLLARTFGGAVTGRPGGALAGTFGRLRGSAIFEGMSKFDITACWANSKQDKKLDVWPIYPKIHLVGTRGALPTHPVTAKPSTLL